MMTDKNDRARKQMDDDDSSSTSSSSSDSDDEPIRKIRINIRPQAATNGPRTVGANNQDLKASVESWRPLAPLPHHSLSRRQSSLSSISMGGNGLHSSPSCSSLVNDFGNRAVFTNFMPLSRTSSPVTINDTIPIAVAIQESISLNIEGIVRNYDPQQQQDTDYEPKFNTRSMGNLKLAFSNALAKGTYGRPSIPLRFSLSPTENIVKFYESRLIKDLTNQTSATNTNNQDANSNTTCDNNVWPDTKTQNDFLHGTSKNKNSLEKQTNSKVFELDTDRLMEMLKKMSDQHPSSRYYNVDVLRYQISPMSSIDRCPLQVCAYWKIESTLIKLRIDFKISTDSGIHMDKLRDISFSVNLSPQADQTMPQVSSQPKAHWNQSIRQLKWKFDLLEPSDGLGSLFAKLDYGTIMSKADASNGGTQLTQMPSPGTVDVKFFVVDSTLSKIVFNIVSSNYRMSMLKKEIRSSGYCCQPFIIV